VSRLRALAGFVPDCAVLFARVGSDPRAPRSITPVLVATGVYLAFPLDLIPDFVPVLGLLDDALVVAAALRFVLRRVGPELVREHWPGPQSSLNALLRLFPHSA
jgi:uncharacterized membrane protein YkvA (DUF1232 family)